MWLTGLFPEALMAAPAVNRTSPINKLKILFMGKFLQVAMATRKFYRVGIGWNSRKKMMEISAHGLETKPFAERCRLISATSLKAGDAAGCFC